MNPCFQFFKRFDLVVLLDRRENREEENKGETNAKFHIFLSCLAASKK